MKFNPNAFEILRERGFIQMTSHEDELKQALAKPITFYWGIDPTASEVHIGTAYGLQAFKILQDCGHRGILLLGGATGQIGDPSLKDDIRKMMQTSEIDSNVTAIQKSLSRFIDVKNTIFVDNADWIRPRGYVDFMQEVGTHFTVSEMLSKECYKNRLGKGLTFLEMGYILMQAYDFLHLNDKYGCTLQIGGSDQWGNILAGVELSRKMSLKNGEPRQPIFALCWSLLTKSDGQKMGKTEKGTLWISSDRTSVYDFYQYFINVDDADVERLLLSFTMLPVHEIKTMCKTDIIVAKKLMAFEVTKRIHGEAATQQAKNQSEQLFSGSGSDAPTETIKAGTKNLVDILALTSIIKSKREARELIESGAIQIDGEKVSDINSVINKKEFLVKKGKKTFLKIILE